MTSIVGLFVCPLLCLYSIGDVGYVARYGLIFLVWPCISIYLCVGIAWATFKFQPHGNFQAIGEVNRTSHRYHFVPLYLADWFRGK